MALTDDQIAFYRRKLGAGVDLTDMESRLTRLEGNDRAVVLEVLEERLATLIATPASFAVPGEYSQDTRDNIAVTQRAVSDARAELDAGEDVDDNLVEIQSPLYAVRPNHRLDTEEASARGRSAGIGR